MQFDFYIKDGKIYSDATYDTLLSRSKARVTYGDGVDLTLHFPSGTVAAGDEVMVAIDDDLSFGADGSGPMTKATHLVTAAEATAQTVSISLVTNTRRFYSVVNGARVPVSAYVGVYLHKATESEEEETEESYQQTELAFSTIFTAPVVALYSDTIVPVEPADIYPTKEEVAEQYVAKADKGVANGVPELDENGKVPKAQLPDNAEYLKLSGGPMNARAKITIRGSGNDALVIDGVHCSLWATAYGSNAGSLSMGVGPNVNITHSYCFASGRNHSSSEQLQFIHGKYSVPKTGARIVGGGADPYSGKNIEELSWSGNHYISGGHQQEIRTIPAAVAAYTPSEGVYEHTPDAAPTYTLPDIADATRTHETVLFVSFAHTTSIAFQDASGNAIVPNGEYDITDGSVFAFLCLYMPLLFKWIVVPVELGDAQ